MNGDFCSCFKRAYTVASENIVKIGSSMKKKVIDGIQDEKPEKKEVFWMRHPKIGYYMPVTHFDDVDVADTNKILSDKPKP
ncbi:senescence-associated gene 21, mitochondrial-like protein isoform X2 [Tanacetum coccineum]